MIPLLSALQLFSLSAFAHAATIGLNFCDAWPAPHIADGAADGFAAWTDSRAEWDWTDSSVQELPLPLGESGVSATWSASGSWSAGSETDNEQALYRVYLDDGETAPGVGVRVTITGLGAWLASNGHTAYQLRCYVNNDADTTFQPLSIRYGSDINGPVLHTMSATALGDGDYPSIITPPTGQSRGYADSPATITADTITITLPPRYGSIRGTLCAIKITGSGTIATTDALTRDRWNELGGWRISDLTSNRLRFLGPPDEILTTPADPAASGIDEDDLGDNYATRHRGFLIAPETGWYRFWISSDDEAELWLADGSVEQPANPDQPESASNPRVPYTNRHGKQLLASIRDERAGTTWTEPGDFDRFPSQRSREVYLTSGHSYYLELLHKDANGPDHLSLAWQPPGQARTLVPASALTSDAPEETDLDNDFLPDAWESEFSLDPFDNGIISATDGQYGDLDGDGLDNLTEFQLGTRPDLVDTDGDGLSDKKELDYYHTDPLRSNLIDFGPETALAPQHYTATTGRWSHDPSGSLSSIDRRSEITFTFTIGADPDGLLPGVIEIILTGGAAGIPRATENLPLVFSIDGYPIASTTLTSLAGASATASVLSPWLTLGTHTLTILHDNYRAELALRIDSLTLRNLGGDDLDENGRPDWLDERLAADNHLTRVPVTSLTSPVCIEGITSHLPGLTLTTSLPSTSSPIALLEGPDSSFFANLPLDETGTPTALHAFFQSGAITETHSIIWQPAELTTLETLDIRQGDSLLLTATSGKGEGNTFGTYSAHLDGILLPTVHGGPNHHPDEPFKVTFDTPGTRTLAVTFNGNMPDRSLTIHVHSADFGPALSARAHFPRDWQPPAVGQDALIQPDSRIAWLETTSPEASARAFRVNSTAPGQRHVLARLPGAITGAPAAILSRGTVNTFYLAYLDETSDIEVSFIYPDGTRLMRGSIVAIDLPPDIAIRLNTYYQGTVFLDGSNQLWLTAADFDQNGIADIWFEWAGQGDPYVCTYVDLFTTEPPPASEPPAAAP